MYKRITMLCLALLLLFTCVPVTQALGVQPYAVVSVRGGLMSTTGGNYILWGVAEGASEKTTITATLYRLEGTKWMQYSSTTSTGSSAAIETSKTINIPMGYQYKVIVVGTTATNSTTMTYLYDFR